MLAIGIGIAMSVLDSSLINIALPTIARELQATPSATIWVVNAYQIAILTSLLPLAALGEHIGYARVYRFGLVLFAASSLACALSNSLAMLIAARAAQGSRCGRPDERERRAGALHLSGQAAGPRRRAERAGGVDGGCHRADIGFRHPRTRPLAMVVRNQRAYRHPEPADRVACAAGFTGCPAAVRPHQRVAERT